MKSKVNVNCWLAFPCWMRIHVLKELTRLVQEGHSSRHEKEVEIGTPFAMHVQWCLVHHKHWILNTWILFDCILSLGIPSDPCNSMTEPTYFMYWGSNRMCEINNQRCVHMDIVIQASRINVGSYIWLHQCVLIRSESIWLRLTSRRPKFHFEMTSFQRSVSVERSTLKSHIFEVTLPRRQHYIRPSQEIRL